MQVCFLLLIQLHITEGCRLEEDKTLKEITAYTRGSVLLPCSCSDLHAKPDTFTWKRNTNHHDWVEISPESDQYRDRFQLVNDHSSGNLSLLISHLTEEDDGDYWCRVNKDDYRDFTLTVKSCKLNTQTVYVIGYVGQSVLLPCSCSELQAKPQIFTWNFLKGSDHKEIFPKDQTNRYTDRVQGFKDHHLGNLSLLISHLTVEDGGGYRCESRGGYSYVHLTVKDAPTRPSSSKPPIKTTYERDVPTTEPTLGISDKTNPPSESPEKESLPFVPFAVVTVIFLHIIVAVVYCSAGKKGPGTVHYNRGDGDGTVNLQ